MDKNMKITFKELKNGESSVNEKLSEIVGKFAVSMGKRYIALIDTIEIGFLYIDFPLNQVNSVCLYNIYVVPEYRNIGFGKTLLQKTEELCLQAERSKIIVYVRPLDDITRYEELVKWYSSNGYNFIENDEGYMEKNV